MNLTKKILIIAGGSGGHVFPGLSIAHYLIDYYGYKIVWLGAVDQIESRLISKYGINIKLIHIRGYRGKKIYQKLITFFLIFLSIYQSLKIIKSWKPDIAFSTGGYVAGPSSLAAFLSRIPLIIHEQNRIMGLTNRFLSFFAKKVLLGFSLLNNLKSKKFIVVGNPLRYSILSIPEPVIRWANRTGPIRVLVLGGSNGSHLFNVVIPQVFLKLSDKLIIWHQSGYQDWQYLVGEYQIFKDSSYKIMPFIDNIEQAYEWADIVISRSGAVTVSEISAIGLPAIFVPFDYHQDKQQYWNAMLLAQSGSAVIIEQKKFTSDYVIKILNSWDRKKLLIMADKSRKLNQFHATKLISDLIVRYSHKKT